ENRALFPHRKSGDSGGSGQGNGSIPTRQTTQGRRGCLHCDLSENAHRRDSGRVHQASRTPEEHGEDTQAEQYLTAKRGPPPSRPSARPFHAAERLLGLAEAVAGRLQSVSP